MSTKDGKFSRGSIGGRKKLEGALFVRPSRCSAAACYAAHAAYATCQAVAEAMAWSQARVMGQRTMMMSGATAGWQLAAWGVAWLPLSSGPSSNATLHYKQTSSTPWHRPCWKRHLAANGIQGFANRCKWQMRVHEAKAMNARKTYSKGEFSQNDLSGW